MTATNVQRILSASETGGSITEGSFADSVKQFFDGSGLNAMIGFFAKVAKAKATSSTDHRRRCIDHGDRQPDRLVDRDLGDLLLHRQPAARFQLCQW